MRSPFWILTLLVCSSILGFAQTPTPAPAEPVAVVISGPALPLNTPRPLRIGVAFTLNNISKVNDFDNNYTANIDLHLKWHDPSLAFDPNEYGTFRRELNLDQAVKFLTKIWSPEITIANMKGAPLSKESCLLIDADGSISYIQRIKAIFDTPYNLAPFPFDTQNFVIKLSSKKYNTSEIEFFQTQEEINQSGIREGFSLAGWNFLNIDYLGSAIRGLDGKFFPEFTIKMTMSRQPLNHLFAMLPLLLIVIVPTILTLYATADVGARLSTWSGAILALIALSFTMQLRYPALPSNGILSQLIATIFAYEFLMICLTMSIFNGDLTRKIKNPFLVTQTIQFLNWQVPFVFLAVIVLSIVLTMARA